MTKIAAPTPDVIKEAADLIRAGDLVAFPTETVYGLGADATNGEAVAKLFAAKGRPSFNPLISHGANLEMLLGEADFDDRALALADKFWPGPLTIILPKSQTARISDLACAGLKTVALRIPDHAVALALIKKSGVPIAAPSANASGTLSPTAPHHVADSLGGAVPLILAGGATQFGLESTVVDLTGAETVIVRAGALTAEDISDCIGLSVTYELSATDKPRSPGQMLRHYAPNIPIRLKAIDLEKGEALLAFGSTKFMGIKGGGKAGDLPPNQIRNLSETGDLLEAAANLFSYIRALDKPEHTRIAVMDIPNTGIGIAINDRLKRASET
ncbi:MAG: threonylcarbamoyl-AMP synthase [Alphaproteobacteria bacterium]|jgi:L-threonylcarbamoyladenylate synthase|nr:threonylcarbamoyl-AMP synthase [Alphaproteobacteria bacterium]